MNNLLAKLEALLFLYGEPITFKKISKVLGVKEEEVKNAIRDLTKNLQESERGLHLVEDEEKVQLVTKSEFGELLQEVVKSELNEELSPASLETLSIILYSTPVSRAEVEYIRGVNSSFILRNLLIRGLIDRETDPERANAFVYKPSLEFLRYLGISKISDLPEFEEFQNLIKNFRNPPPNEPPKPL